jgi:hypothetical protein
MVEKNESSEESQEGIEISHIQKIYEGVENPRNSELDISCKSPLLQQSSQNQYKKHISTKIDYQAFIMLQDTCEIESIAEGKVPFACLPIGQLPLVAY